MVARSLHRPVDVHHHFRPMALLASAFALSSASLTAQVVIPLQMFASNQIGISVQLGTAPQPFTYLLDTGSVAFLSASGSSSYWDGAFASTTPGETFDISYGGGALRYQGIVAHTTLTFQTVGGGSFQVDNVRMGAITTPPAIHPTWNADINSDPPIAPESGQFFGTFGAGLNKSAATNGNFTSILGQIPLTGGLANGFVVHTGGAQSTSATLTVGLSQEMIDSFPILIAMNPLTGTNTNDNGTVVNLYPQAQTTANYSITHGLDSYHASADLILDTGGLDTYMTTGTELDPPGSLLDSGPSRIRDGSTFLVEVPATDNPFSQELAQPFEWLTSPTGTTAYENLISVFTGSGNGSLNSGIPIFYQYDVMFDTENGIIGLRPIPEPSALLLAALSGALAALIARTTKSRSRRSPHSCPTARGSNPP